MNSKQHYCVNVYTTDPKKSLLSWGMTSSDLVPLAIHIQSYLTEQNVELQALIIKAVSKSGLVPTINEVLSYQKEKQS